MRTTKWLMLSIVLLFLINGCKKEDPKPEDKPVAVTYGPVVFIINEGPFGSGTGTISLYNRSSGEVSNDVFQNANGYPLGNIVQSMSLHNDKGYIVVNNAKKVEVVNTITFKTVATITGLNQPRNFLGIDNTKGYVTEWGTTEKNGAVRVINLSNNTISSTIPTGAGAEKMVRLNNGVYVTCKGGHTSDSVVTVINTVTDAVTTTINTGPNPSGIEVDANGKIWVLCGGQWNSGFTALEKTGRLVRINPVNNTVEETFTFTSTTSSPSNLTMNGAKNKLYYSYQGAIYTQDISTGSLSSSPFISRSFYSLGVDPVNDNVYGSDARNFSSKGFVIRYSAAGVKVDSFQVGIIPGGFSFK